MKNIDVFKYYPKFTVKQENGLKTSVGGFFTVLLGLLILAFSYLSGCDLLYKKNPTIIESTMENKNPYLSRNDLFIALTISDMQGNSIPNMEKYFNITFGYLIANSSSEKITQYRQFKSEKCYLSSKVFIENKNEILNKLPNKHESFYCATEQVNVDLSGVYGEKAFNIWDIRLSLCKNTTENNNQCSSEEERESLFKQFYGVVFINSRKINFSNYTNPIESSYTSFIQRISIYSSRQDIFTINQMILSDDVGFLLSNIKEISNYAYDSKTSDFMVGFDSGYVYRTVLTLSSTTTKFERSYKKLQDIASTIGGMFQFLMVAFAFISNSFSKIAYLDYLSSLIINNKNSYYVNWQKVVYKQRKINKDNCNITSNARFCTVNHSNSNVYRISPSFSPFKAFDDNNINQQNYNVTSDNINNQYSNNILAFNSNNNANYTSHCNNINLFQNYSNSANNKNYFNNVTKIIDTSKNLNSNKDIISNISYSDDIANSNLLLLNNNQHESTMNKLNNRIISINNNDSTYKKGDLDMNNDFKSQINSLNSNLKNNSMIKLANADDYRKIINKDLSDEEPKYSYKRYNTNNYYDTYHNLNNSENRNKFDDNIMGEHTFNERKDENSINIDKHQVDEVVIKNNEKYFSFKQTYKPYSNMENKEINVDRSIPYDNTNNQNNNNNNNQDIRNLNIKKAYNIPNNDLILNKNYLGEIGHSNKINNTNNINNTKDNIISDNNKSKSKDLSNDSIFNKDVLERKREIDEIYDIISNYSLFRQFLEYYLCCKFKSKKIKKQIINRVINCFAIESYINVYEDLIIYKAKLIKNTKDFETIKWNNIITTMFTNKDPKNDNWYLEALKNC